MSVLTGYGAALLPHKGSDSGKDPVGMTLFPFCTQPISLHNLRSACPSLSCSLMYTLTFWYLREHCLTVLIGDRMSDQVLFAFGRAFLIFSPLQLHMIACFMQLANTTRSWLDARAHAK